MQDAFLVEYLTSFVTSIAAIVLGVAFPGGRNAPAVVAGELGGVASDVDATRLIRRITAVVIRVTSERIGDAAAGGALELVSRAGRLGAVLILVRIVETVIISVTNPSHGDAALVIAREIPNIRTSL